MSIYDLNMDVQRAGLPAGLRSVAAWLVYMLLSVWLSVCCALVHVDGAIEQLISRIEEQRLPVRFPFTSRWKHNVKP